MCGLNEGEQITQVREKKGFTPRGRKCSMCGEKLFTVKEIADKLCFMCGR